MNMRKVVWRALLISAVLAAAAGAESHIPKYRRSDWPHWLRVPGTCWDTRDQVLRDEALEPPMLDDDGCHVTAGRWRDVYTGEELRAPRLIDIDHVVPLSWAHRHGGWAWARAERRRYANDLSDADHLLAVSARANRQKGDRGPDAWVPRREAQCWYGQAWDRIVRRWRLTITSGEQEAIRGLIATCMETAVTNGWR